MAAAPMTKDILLKSLWDDAHAATLDEPGRLLYRSNLLGSDLRITNFGGGNTSAKVAAKDPLTGADVQVLWVKGSGGDIGSDEAGRVRHAVHGPADAAAGAVSRASDQEDAMVEALGHCIFNLNPRAPSIDTWLHGFVPYARMSTMSIRMPSSPLPPRRSGAADAGDLRR
jgi:rhamnose utilization protein RhaD (predicted bifunctional aldolase and dehydrogenase)